MAGKSVSEIYYWEMQVDELIIQLVSSKKGAVRVRIGLKKDSDCSAYLKEKFPSCRIIKDYDMNRPLVREVEAAMSNRPALRELPLDIPSTRFQLMVWKAISHIPFGQTKTYGEVASLIGKPGGARAIGQAMNKNPLPLIFP